MRKYYAAVLHYGERDGEKRKTFFQRGFSADEQASEREKERTRDREGERKQMKRVAE